MLMHEKTCVTPIFKHGIVNIMQAYCKVLAWSLHKVSEYKQEMTQSHTAGQPTAPRGRCTEHL